MCRTDFFCKPAVNSPLIKQLQVCVCQLCWTNLDIFITKLGQSSLGKLKIETTVTTPTCCKLRPVNAQKKEIMDECLPEMLDKDLIEPGTSPWASPAVLIPQKSGGYRTAIDYNALSAKTSAPAYLVPRTDWALAQFGKAQWFTSLDLSQGFFQIPLAAEMQPRQLSVPQGIFHSKCMPLGLAGAPTAFQMLTDEVLQASNTSHVCPF